MDHSSRLCGPRGMPAAPWAAWGDRAVAAKKGHRCSMLAPPSQNNVQQRDQLVRRQKLWRFARAPSWLGPGPEVPVFFQGARTTRWQQCDVPGFGQAGTMTPIP